MKPLKKGEHRCFSGYKVINQLGSGVSGTTFLAEKNNQKYAIKEITIKTEEWSISPDEQIKQSMCMLFETMGIAVEPAAAAGLAGAVGPLKDHIKNKKTAIILCGSNMGIDEFCQLIKKTKK